MTAIVTNWFKPSECLPTDNRTIIFIRHTEVMIGLFNRESINFIDGADQSYYDISEIDWWAVLTTP